MKKTIISMCIMQFALCTSLMAQVKMDHVTPQPNAHKVNLNPSLDKRMPSLDLSFIENMAEDNSVQSVEEARLSVRANAATENKRGYRNPIGTLMLGITPTGANTYVKAPGVIGAWSEFATCWEWPNVATGNWTNIKYDVYWGSTEDGENYGVKADGSFCDSLMAKGGYNGYRGYTGDCGQYANGNTNYAYYINHSTPVQTITRTDGTTERFLFLSTANSPNPDRGTFLLSVAGLPSSDASEMWPLTNAVCKYQGNGTHVDLIDNSNVYLFGTDANADNSAADEFIIYYEKPQGPLYVQNITLALGARGFKSKNDTLKVSPLQLQVISANGEVIASTTADVANMVKMKNYDGQMLTFNFDQYSSYDELIKEGFLVNEEFSIHISGIGATDHFGVYAAPTVVEWERGAHSAIHYADGTTVEKDVDPYLMLNGVFVTMEDYYSVQSSDMKELIGIHGDTIPVAFYPADGLGYKYVCGFANTSYEGQQEFAFYSTFKPYNETTRYWNMDIERPSYILMAADYEYNMGDEEEVDPRFTLWNYYRMFTLYIYATEKPKVGDTFSIGKGRHIVFDIVEVKDADENANKNPQSVINNSKNNTLAQKLLQNNQLVIVRGDKTYNLIGTAL